MRGEDLKKISLCQGPLGNTPTCVGKTFFGGISKDSLEKHPHVRGEDHFNKCRNSTRFRNTPTCVGKTENYNADQLAKERNTPTCVGKTSLNHGKGRFFPETPPRAWGRLQPLPFLFRQHRNTPTCVGKTVNGRCLVVIPEETPPRAWGRRIKDRPESASIGNTPTCVGKTTVRDALIALDEKHPHVRGEDRRTA